MKFSRIFLFLFIVIAFNGLVFFLNNLPEDAGTDVPEGKINSFSYAPFREGQSPLTKIYPTTDQIDDDLNLLSSKTHNIRTYSSRDGMETVPLTARKYGLKVTQGAWLSSLETNNDAEIAQVIKLANEYPDVITRVIVGNEVLLRGELKVDKLIDYIRQVKQAIKQPVSYADVWSFYLRYPQIANELDYYTVHILPYWEDEPLKIDETVARVEENYSKIRDAFPGKPILIGESGWPSAGRQRGGAIPSVLNEAKFIRSLVELSNKNGFDYNVVEAFNQPWKSKLEGVVGANWGVFSSDRKRVFPLTGKVIENTNWPKCLIFVSLITSLLVAARFKSILELKALQQFVLIAFTQILTALLISQINHGWYTSYEVMQRIQVVFVGGLSFILEILLLQHTLNLLHNKLKETTGVWIRYIFMAFVAIALYKSQSLAMSGRYLSFPYPTTYIPVIGIIGFMLIRFFKNGCDKSIALQFNDLLGYHVISTKRMNTISYVLAATGILLIIIEAIVILKGGNYNASYPNLLERLYEVFIVTINYNQLLGCALLMAAIVIKIPLRITAVLLVIMAIEIIIGESIAYIILHDFVTSYPDLNKRILMGFYYTITNGQLLLWISSVLTLAITLWDYQEDQRNPSCLISAA